MIKNIKLLPKYSLGEEIFNSVTHGLGALAAIFFTIFLSLKFSYSGKMIAASIIYGACLFIMYISSTLYHAITNKTAKSVLRFFDHIAIYLTIGGTYVPILCAMLEGKILLISLSVVWGLCVLGIILKFIEFNNGMNKIINGITMFLYLFIGRISLLLIKQMLASLGLAVFIRILSGGILYSIGCVFYSIKKPYFHSIRHIFILLASVSHFIALIIV